MEYIKYRGYYIGQGPNDFHSRDEIDAFIRGQMVRRLQTVIGQMLQYTDADQIMAASLEADRIEQQMHADGMSWEEIEAAEIPA